MIQRYTKFLMCAIEFPHNFSFAWYCLCLLLRQVTLFTLVGALLIFARGQFLPLLRSRRRLFSASGNMGFAHLLKHATSYSTIAATTHNRKIGRTGAWQSLLGFVIVRKGRRAVFFHFPWRWLLTSSSSFNCCWTYVSTFELTRRFAFVAGQNFWRGDHFVQEKANLRENFGSSIINTRVCVYNAFNILVWEKMNLLGSKETYYQQTDGPSKFYVHPSNDEMFLINVSETMTPEKWISISHH